MSEHRFAARVEPIGPPPPEVRRSLSARRLWAGGFAFLRGITGLDAYDRYAAHQRRAHPGCPVQSEAEFWRESWAESARNPKARCC